MVGVGAGKPAPLFFDTATPTYILKLINNITIAIKRSFNIGGTYMSKINQKEAVFQAITSVLAEAAIDFEEGQDVGAIMTKELRSQVNQILFEGFKGGTIEIAKEFSDTDLKAYVSGLQSNWIRKDKRLNGNTQYVAKNPGSRVGSGDAMLKNLKALLSTLEVGSPDHTEVQACITTRTTEIASTKAKVTVDFSALPESLRIKYNK
jgi:hypothetical protein